MPHKVFNLNEAAYYLHMPPADLEDLARRGEVPCVRAGERLVFRRREIDAWASQRIFGFTRRRLEDYHRATSVKYHDLSQERAIIPELLRPAWCEPALPARTRPSVVREMVALAGHTGLLLLEDDLLRSLEERERLMSTALSGGVAMLHPAHHDPYLFDDSFLTVARGVQPIPFGSPDGRTTDVFFLICCQDDRIHLHVLARLCMVCFHTDALERLREATAPEDMYRALLESEAEVLRGM